MRKLILIPFLILLIACQGQPTATIEPEPTEETAVVEPTQPSTDIPISPTEVVEEEMEEEEAVEMETAVPEPTATDTPTEEPTEPTSAPDTTSDPLDDEAITNIMYDLLEPESVTAGQALTRAVNSRDPRFIAVIIELYRARQIGLVQITTLPDYITALERLSGETFGHNWAAWIEWYGQTDLVPPEGFTSWKGRLYTLIDPGFGEFLQDRYPSAIRVEEIQWGGVTVDGIPPLEHSPMIAAAAADYMNPEDPVFGLHINDEARAYPLRIMDWHELANDTVGGVPVSLVYCTLCGAAVAYDGRANDGNIYSFGTSGFLFRSNKLMYDRQTRTLWNQLTGQPVLGELVDTDVTLPILPVVLTTWEEWQVKHPDTLVLDDNTGFARDYTPGAAYGDYFAFNDTMFPVAQRSSLLGAKDHIFALRVGDLPAAYPVETITEEGVVNDVVGETAVTIIANRGIITVEGDSYRAGAVTYTAGGEVRAYERGDNEFSPTDDPDVIVDADGNEWQVTEDMLIGPDGATLTRLGGHLAYWFGWFAFFPNTQVYSVDQ